MPAELAAVKTAVLDRASAHPLGPREGLTRACIEELRVAGATKAEVVTLVTELLGAATAAHIGADLDQYGDWAE